MTHMYVSVCFDFLYVSLFDPLKTSHYPPSLGLKTTAPPVLMAEFYHFFVSCFAYSCSHKAGEGLLISRYAHPSKCRSWQARWVSL